MSQTSVFTCPDMILDNYEIYEIEVSVDITLSTFNFANVSSKFMSNLAAVT